MGPYFTRTLWGMGRLYCGDSNGHVHFESFSSHISLTLRTPVLFIFGQVTRIGHGMKYILTSLDECPGKRRRRLQSFYLSMQERDKSRQSELKSIRFKHCADCQCSKSSNFTRSQVHCLREDELKAQTDPSQVRNWSLISQPRSEFEELNWKLRERGTNIDWPGANSENSSSHPQLICKWLSIMTRGHTQRQSKVLSQQLHQVEMNDGCREEEVNW